MNAWIQAHAAIVVACFVLLTTLASVLNARIPRDKFPRLHALLTVIAGIAPNDAPKWLEGLSRLVTSFLPPPASGGGPSTASEGNGPAPEAPTLQRRAVDPAGALVFVSMGLWALCAGLTLLVVVACGTAQTATTDSVTAADALFHASESACLATHANEADDRARQDCGLRAAAHVCAVALVAQTSDAAAELQQRIEAAQDVVSAATSPPSGASPIFVFDATPYDGGADR